MVRGGPQLRLLKMEARRRQRARGGVVYCSRRRFRLALTAAGGVTSGGGRGLGRL